MRNKPNLRLDISQSEPSPPAKTEVRKKINYKEHTNYVDLVRNLRNPTTARLINQWTETGRKVGKLVSVPPNQDHNMSRGRKSTPKVLNHKRAFEEDKSDSFDNSMDEDVYSDEDIEEQVKANQYISAALKAGILKPTEFSTEHSASEDSGPEAEQGQRSKETHTNEGTNKEWEAMCAALEESDKKCSF